MREGERDRERKQERGVHKRGNKKQWLSQEKQVAKGQDQQKNDYSLYTFLYFLYFIPCKCISYSVCVCVYTQSCLTLCDPVDCSLPGSSVHGIFQARILEWVAISYSRGSSQARDQTPVCYVSCIARGFFTTATWGAH